MKLIRTLIFFVSIFTCINAFGQDRGFGAGIIIGEPTGISMKNWLTQKTAFDVGVAWSFTHETSFHVHADYLMHTTHVFEDEEAVPLYYGIGGRIKIGDNERARIGVRMVCGIEHMFQNAPFDLFLELAPILDLIPRTELNANAGIGARYYFH